MVLTGAESDLGRKTTQDLLATGEYHVIGGVRSLQSFSEKEQQGFTPMECDLESFDSVRNFCSQVEDFRLGKPLDRLVCHAGDAEPTKELQWTKDDHEKNIQTHFLSPVLMTGLLLNAMEASYDARLTLVCPPEAENAKIANLVDLKGFEAGFKKIPMVDGSTEFNSKKATADAKLCQKLLTNFLHEKYHKLNDVSFNDISISDSSSDGLFEVVHDPKAGGSNSGMSWKSSSSSSDSEGESIVACDDKDDGKTYDIDKAYKLFSLAQKVTKAEWPKIKVVTSPCPTLKVVGAVTKAQVQKQELKRMREMGRPGIAEPEVVSRVTKRQKIAAAAERVTSFVFRNTVKRFAKVATSKMLGEFPDEAVNNYIENISEEDMAALEIEIFQKLSKEESDKKLKTDKSKIFCFVCIVIDCCDSLSFMHLLFSNTFCL